MAHKKGQGSVKNGRDSESKRLGVKRADGQFVLAGNIAEFLVFAANKFFSTFLTIILDLFRYFHLIGVLGCDAKIGSGFGTCKGL